MHIKLCTLIFTVLASSGWPNRVSAQEPQSRRTPEQDVIETLKSYDQTSLDFGSYEKALRVRISGRDNGFCKEKMTSYGCSRIQNLPKSGKGSNKPFKNQQHQEHFFVLECTDHCGETREFEAAFDVDVQSDGLRTEIRNERLRVTPLSVRGTSQAEKPSDHEDGEIRSAKRILVEAETCFETRSKTIQGQIEPLAAALVAATQDELNKGIAEENISPEMLIDYHLGKFLLGSFERLGVTRNWDGKKELDLNSVVIALSFLTLRLNSQKQEKLAHRIGAYETELAALSQKAYEARAKFDETAWSLNSSKRFAPEGQTCFPHESTFDLDSQGLMSFYGPLAHQLEQKLTGKSNADSSVEPNSVNSKNRSPLQFVQDPSSEPMQLGYLFPELELSSTQIPNCPSKTQGVPLKEKLSRATPRSEPPESSATPGGLTQGFSYLKDRENSFGIFVGTRNLEEFVFEDPRLVGKIVGGASSTHPNASSQVVPRAVVVPRELVVPSPDHDDRIQKVIERLELQYGVGINFDPKACHYTLDEGALPLPVVVDDGNRWSLKNRYLFSRCGPSKTAVKP